MHHRRQRGFTLMEVMVVVVIIAVMIGAVSLTLSSSRSDVIQTESQRLLALMRLASDEAVLRGTHIGWLRTPGGYEFVMPAGDGTWRPIESGGPLGPRELPEFVDLEVLAEGQPVAAPEEGDEGGEHRPQTLFFSSGEVYPFEVIVRGERLEPYYRIEAGIHGDIQLHNES